LASPQNNISGRLNYLLGTVAGLQQLTNLVGVGDKRTQSRSQPLLQIMDFIF
jgi:hypothetical protein